MQAPDDPEKDRHDDSDGTDDTLSWLDALTGPPSPGASSKETDNHQADEEKPAGDDIPEWLRGDLEKAMTGNESLPDWLTSELNDDETESEPEDAGDQKNVDLEATMIGPLSVAVSIEDEGPNEDLYQDEVGADLSWLEMIAAGEGEAIEEPPTMSWEDEVRLDQADISFPADVPEEVRKDFEGAEAAADALDLAEQVPEDPDDAMAWLEHLAAQQGAPLEELPTLYGQTTVPAAHTDNPEEDLLGILEEPIEHVAEGFILKDQIEEGALSVIAEDEPAELDIPEDPDEAILWLEEQAAIQSALVEQEPAVKGVTDETAEEAPAVDEELEQALAMLAEVELPEDEEEAMAWLTQLAAHPAQAAEVKQDVEDAIVVEQAITPTTPHDVVQARAEAEAMLQLEEAGGDQDLEDVETPEDEEAALAWLDQLAGEDSGTDELAAILLEEDALPVAEVISDSTAEGLDEEIDIMPSTAFPDIDESLDWLALEPEKVAVDDELDWLDSLGDLDATGWLAAEEDALDERHDEEDIAAEFIEPLIFKEIWEEEKLEASPVSETTLEMPEVPAGIDSLLLDKAHASIDAGDIGLAAEGFEALIASGSGVPYLIADLETIIGDHGDEPHLKRLLGDAYLRNGQVKRAIDIYRQALAEL